MNTGTDTQKHPNVTAHDRVGRGRSPQVVTIIESPSANLNSIFIALRRIQTELHDSTGRTFSLKLSHDPQEILQSDRVIFPGVGHAGYIMKQLYSSGLDRVLHQVAEARVPLMGICMGMQLLFEKLSEGDRQLGLGLLPGSIVPLRPALDRLSEPASKQRQTKMAVPQKVAVPHMGWNRIEAWSDNDTETRNADGRTNSRVLQSLCDGLETSTDTAGYFVHSYYLAPGPETLAICRYGGLEISAIVRGTKHGDSHIWGCQFHPEKSGRFGSRILRNWLEYADTEYKT
ncbi:imidazole glycerol phosphate synthase subunit HisH [Candidatus Haliotispira prima]|uniref:Imidazole glycerol phosphate synthase subunit HisH n=1 Tax=Candidatus Haliotispira prima TaxID=3034016 RepID=A0ABY8MIH4_9SPIO|nr:imidazole glycerol phosphate synthase subunit HisH [Candidatus Haliotispira prima]